MGELLMTKVYIVNQFDATPYEHFFDGVHKVFSSREAAEKYLEEMGTDEAIHADEDDWGGYFLSKRIEELVVHD